MAFDLLCMIWKPIRRLLGSMVQFAAKTVTRLTKLALTLLKELAGALGDISGSSGIGTFGMIAIAAVGFYFLTKNGKDKDKSSSVPSDGYSGMTYDMEKSAIGAMT